MAPSCPRWPVPAAGLQGPGLPCVKGCGRPVPCTRDGPGARALLSRAHARLPGLRLGRPGHSLCPPGVSAPCPPRAAGSWAVSRASRCGSPVRARVVRCRIRQGCQGQAGWTVTENSLSAPRWVGGGSCHGPGLSARSRTKRAAGTLRQAAPEASRSGVTPSRGTLAVLSRWPQQLLLHPTPSAAVALHARL